MNNIFKGVIISAMALLSLTFISCGDDNEDDIVVKQPQILETLPNAENVKATTAYIPINTSDLQGTVEICWASEEKNIAMISGDDNSRYSEFNYYLTTMLKPGSTGYQFSGLEPDQTYYYTIVYHPANSKDPVYSKQYKSFTTKAASVEFIEPATVSMGNWDRQVLRMKVSGVDECDMPGHILVTLYSVRKDSESVSIYTSTNYIGEGIWQNDTFLDEDEYYMAVISTGSGQIFAKTPVVKLVDGKIVEVEEDHRFDEILNK